MRHTPPSHTLTCQPVNIRIHTLSNPGPFGASTPSLAGARIKVPPGLSVAMRAMDSPTSRNSALQSSSSTPAFDSEQALASNHPWYDSRRSSPASVLLNFVHYFSAAILLFLFLFAFTIRSVLASKHASSDASHQPSALDVHRRSVGPGGKPLPSQQMTGIRRRLDKQRDFPRAQKQLFIWLSVIAAGTYAASAAVICIRVLGSSWWCGEAVVVSM